MALKGDYEPSPAGWVREQVETYESSGGQRGNTLRDTGLPVIIVTTRGNRSGKLRKTPLMRVEHDGEYALVASRGGSPTHPVWYYNLKSDPGAVTIQDGTEPFDAEVREVSGAERAAWWDRAVAAYPPYAEYQTRTERTIPVFRGLPPQLNVPSDLVLKTMNAVHRLVLKASGGKLGWEASRMPVIELTTTGRKSGRPHTVMLTSPLQEGPRIVVVASRGGDDHHPSWFLNLRDDPHVEVAMQRGPRRPMLARVAGPDERAELWPRVVADHRSYGGYQARTGREIPLVLLEPTD